jgi:hypothetical protein
MVVTPKNALGVLVHVESGSGLGGSSGHTDLSVAWCWRSLSSDFETIICSNIQSLLKAHVWIFRVTRRGFGVPGSALQEE